MSIKMELSYPREVEEAKRECKPVLLPIGTMEWHSEHCPYGCDTLTAYGVAERVAREVDAMILPPVWYGVASYAVGGPDKNTLNVDCDTMEDYVYCILKSLFAAGFKKNIFILIAHQTEDYMPMTLACMKAAKKLIMADLEESGGYGWWGKNENADFYESLAEKDSPWNRIRVIRLPYTPSCKGFGDHAGVHESSMLEALYPGSIKLERLSDDWFAATAKDMTVEHGEEIVSACVYDIVKMIKGE